MSEHVMPPGAGVARISSKNQITLPVNVLRRLDLHPGDQVEVMIEGDGTIRLVPRRHVPDFQRFIGTVPMDRTGDDLVDDLRGEISEP